jgi:chlorophyllide a reductase subunit Z
MGYAGATYVVQEYCNALFDALFHILPLGTELDKIEATHAKDSPDWEPEALQAVQKHLETEPYLVRISASARLRDAAEQAAHKQGAARITAAHVAQSLSSKEFA